MRDPLGGTAGGGGGGLGPWWLPLGGTAGGGGGALTAGFGGFWGPGRSCGAVAAGAGSEAGAACRGCRLLPLVPPTPKQAEAVQMPLCWLSTAARAAWACSHTQAGSLAHHPCQSHVEINGARQVGGKGSAPATPHASARPLSWHGRDMCLPGPTCQQISGAQQAGGKGSAPANHPASATSCQGRMPAWADLPALASRGPRSGTLPPWHSWLNRASDRPSRSCPWALAVATCCSSALSWGLVSPTAAPAAAAAASAGSAVGLSILWSSSSCKQSRRMRSAADLCMSTDSCPVSARRRSAMLERCVLVITWSEGLASAACPQQRLQY